MRRPHLLEQQAIDRLAGAKQIRLLVFSDSHGYDDPILRLARRHPEADLILHLGDHCAPLSDLTCQLDRPLLGVAGNCDGWTGHSLPGHRLLILAGHRLFMTHGHLFGVKQSTLKLCETAIDQPYMADIILFGHTHHFLQKAVSANGRQALMINPGSAGSNDIGQTPSAVLITLTSDQVICERLLDRT